MEQLNKIVEKQEQLAEELNKKFINIKKDPRSRKTEAYLLEKLKEIDDIWQEFSSQHQEIAKITGKSTENPYIKTNYFNQVEVIYLKAKAYLREQQEILRDRTNDAQVQKICDQERRIDLLRADIESSKTATEGYEQYLEDIKKQFMIVVDKDIELSRIRHEYSDRQYYKEDTFHNIKREYRTATIALDRQIKQQRCLPTHTTNTMALPRLTIPFFNGKYDEWPTFQDIFATMIDTNVNISMVEKMQYLKTYVKGEAEKAIQHYEITETNYTSAWNELKERYDNKRRIVNKLINKILHIPQTQRESAENLKTLYNTVKECLEALKCKKLT